MPKLYDKISPFSTPFVELYNNLLNSFIPFSSFMPLDFIKDLPLISLSIACKESVIISDLASFIAPKLDINFDSAKKNIERFLSNKNFDFNFFYSKFISLILSSYKIKHPDKRIHISVDHGDIEDRFTVLMFTLKIGKQGIPLFFRVFPFHDKEAYSFSLFMEGIDFCHNLFKSIDPLSLIIFLFDRHWANHFKLMKFINSLNDTYCIRTKGNTTVFYLEKKEGHTIKTSISNLPSKIYRSTSYYDIPLSYKHHHMNLVISSSHNHKDPFYILTNGEPKRAVKDYSYRFGSIEFFFKSLKTNGFFLEESQIKDLYTFNSLYTCLCIANVLLTMLGIDYSKNSNCYKYKINNARIVNGKRRKDYSFFHIGLILLQAALDGIIKIFHRMILYDV